MRTRRHDAALSLDWSPNGKAGIEGDVPALCEDTQASGAAGLE